MAKKKAMKKPAMKKPATKKATTKQPAAVAPNVVVFYELSGVAGVRYHAEYSDIERARIAARVLVSSSDVGQAWILRDVEIVTSPST